MLFVALLALLCNRGNGQDYCSFVTSGLPKSGGFNMKIFYPCSFVGKNGERPHIIKVFTETKDNCAISLSVAISKLNVTMNAQSINEALSDKSLRESFANKGKIISVRQVYIDGEKAGEVVLQVTRETPAGTTYMHIINYYLYYRDIAVGLAYSSASFNKADELLGFEDNKTLFRSLATQTVLTSKWK